MTRVLGTLLVGAGFLVCLGFVFLVNWLQPHLTRRSLRWSWNRPPARHRADTPVRHPVREWAGESEWLRRLRLDATARSQARIAAELWSRLPSWLPGQRRAPEQETAR